MGVGGIGAHQRYLNWRQEITAADIQCRRDVVRRRRGSDIGDDGVGQPCQQGIYATSLAEIEEALTRMERFITKHKKEG